MESEVIEITIEKSVVGNLVKRFNLRVLDAVVKAEIVADQNAVFSELPLQPCGGVRFCPAEVERVVDVPLHEPEIDQDVIHGCVRLEHEQVVGNMNIEVVQDLQCVLDCLKGTFSIEVAQASFRGIFHAEKYPEYPQVVQYAHCLAIDTVRAGLDCDGNILDPLSPQPGAQFNKARQGLFRILQEKVVILEVEDPHTVGVIKLLHLGNDVGYAPDAEL